MNEQERKLQSEVENIVDDATARRLLNSAAREDTAELRVAMARMQRDQIGARSDIATLRRDLTEGFSTLHTRFAVLHRDMARMVALLEQIRRSDSAA